MTDPGPAAPSPPDPIALLKTRSYIGLLVMGAIIGVPVAAASYYFLKAINRTQQYVFTTLPNELGFHGAPVWWPVLPLALSGVIVACSIQYLPGTSGHEPTEGFHPGGLVEPRDLYGIAVASFATLALGVVLGPEMPLVAGGTGLGVLAVRLIKRDAPAQATLVIGAAGSFAAIASLLGSPIVGAFLLMEAAGLGGPLLGIILMPGLLAAGIGSLIFVGLYHWTGYGPFTLSIPDIPPFKSPDGWEFLWALAIGLLAPVLAYAIRWIALSLKPIADRHRLLVLPLVGLVVAGCAIAFAEATGHSSSQVLFSGENALAPLVENAATWTAGALVLLVAFKSLAYGVSLSGFRGGPTFPAMFIGAAGGIALSHLPGLPMIAGVAMGIGAMTVAVLKLPLTSVMLASLFLQADSLALMPLVIVAVVVSYVVTARVTPAPAAEPAPAPGQPEPAPSSP
jgi:H+/Cl- antiporter ClcA